MNDPGPRPPEKEEVEAKIVDHALKGTALTRGQISDLHIYDGGRVLGVMYTGPDGQTSTNSFSYASLERDRVTTREQVLRLFGGNL